MTVELLKYPHGAIREEDGGFRNRNAEVAAFTGSSIVVAFDRINSGWDIIKADFE